MATQQPDQLTPAAPGALLYLLARLGLAVPALAGAAWFVLVAGVAGAIALGLTPAHDFARGLAAFMLAPAAALFTVPLIDAAVALLRGRMRSLTWARIMAEALSALILAVCATTLTLALWPGIAALALTAGLGYLFGFRHWHPQRLVAMEASLAAAPAALRRTTRHAGLHACGRPATPPASPLRAASRLTEAGEMATPRQRAAEGRA